MSAEEVAGYPLSVSSWGPEEIEALHRVIASGQFTMAHETLRYQEAFAEFLGQPYCVAVNSGSTANLLMVAALFCRKEQALKPDDEVIVPAVSWPTTYYPLSQYGLRLRFVDIDLHTLNYDLDALRRAVSERTRLIMVVNLLGNPNDFSAISDLANEFDIPFIEDNCESLGATYDGRQAGTLGLMGSFSGFFSHHISTMEGGVICTADEELYHLLLSLRAHGWTRDLPRHNQVTGVKSDDPFEESFKFVLPGYSVRPLEMSCAAGVEQLRKLQGFISDRRRNAGVFQELMSRHPDFIIQQEIGESSWFGFSLVVRPDSDLERADALAALRRHRIDCRPIVAGNFVNNPVMRFLNHEVAGELTNADLIDQRGFFLGNHEGSLSGELALLDRALSTIRG